MLCPRFRETFLYSTITDVSVMQPATLYHYVIMEKEGLEHLWGVFKEATVVMIRTRGLRRHRLQVQSGHSHDHEIGPRDDDNENDQ